MNNKPSLSNEIEIESISFWQAFKFWLKLGFISFGGPAGQIAVMHQELVEEKKWISEQRFMHALNYCMLLPGPEAQQLATYIGWLMHSFELQTPALNKIAEIVHFLDVGGNEPAEALGIEKILQGLRSTITDDDQLLHLSNHIFDGLYADFQRNLT